MDLALIAHIAKVTDHKVFDSAHQVYQRYQSIHKTILSKYCLKCRKDTESKNPKVVKTKRKMKEYFFYQNVQCVIVIN